MFYIQSVLIQEHNEILLQTRIFDGIASKNTESTYTLKKP